MEQLGELWPLLRKAITEIGPGCLWKLCWDEQLRWQVLCVPPHDAKSLPIAETPGSHEHDAWVIACALISIAVGRAPRDVSDAIALLDLHGGVVHGVDAVVNALLCGDKIFLNHTAQVYSAIQTTSLGRVGVRAAAETAVGSAKAGYDLEYDNEDSYGSVHTADGGMSLIVCDGVTGDNDGNGALASRAAVRALKDALAEDGDLMVALTSADRAVRSVSGGASTALVVTVYPDGRADLCSVGDSSAWLVRPRKHAGRIAFRLTPAHTVLAQDRRSDPAATDGESRLTQNLGGSIDQRYRGLIRVMPGDLLVLLSDGAAVSEQGWFGTDLALLADANPQAPALAAALTSRAERLGGHDNATAVVTEIIANP
ncbi:PP2C family protein-serine/threonine phosphatase [Rhodococcus aetherivorans]|uniref:PP2C family protein-serine/threonine phosphatase n=1 Tax=Rhodococcus aetherivorans TaxID=191292 RepID=UPI000EAF9C99|nr:SpoIIE family protein phosphatase [Rhodococcus aetherivorans]